MKFESWPSVIRQILVFCRHRCPGKNEGVYGYILPFSPALHSRRKMEASILCHTYFCTQIILFLGVKKRNKENWDEENKVQMCKKNWKCIKRSVFSRKTKIYVTKQLLFVVVLLVVGIWQDKFGRKTFEQIHVREKVFQVKKLK